MCRLLSLPLLLLPLLGLCPAGAEGSGCHPVRVSYAAPVYQAPVYAAPSYITAATFVPVPLLYPTWSAQYVGGDVQQLRDEVRQLREALQQQRPTAPVMPQAQAQAATPQALPAASDELAQLLGNCASCHDKGVAPGKGGGFVLTEGTTTRALSEAEALKCLVQIRTGKMPKGGKLSPAQKERLADWVLGLK